MELLAPTADIVADVDPDDADLAIKLNGTTVIESIEFEIDRLFGWFHSVDWSDGGDITVGDRRTIDETYEMATGKARERCHRAVETTLVYTHPDATGEIEVILRVAEEGVAFRYRATGEGRSAFYGDATTVHPPTEAMAWLMPFDRAHEASVRQLPAFEAEGEYCTPGLFEVNGEWCLLCESGVDGNYSAAHFTVEDGEYTFDHPTHIINVPFPLETPWRVAIVGDLEDVVESTLVADLAGEPEFDGPVEPGRVAWSWWSESDSPDDFDRQREYVDYAAERGWEYVLFDSGWEAREGEMPELVEYALSRGVRPFLWAHWTSLNTESKRADRFDEWTDWGIAGVKIDFMDHDDQGRMQFYDHVAADAAEHNLMVNFHGSIVPTGLQRRHPNVMTYEGVYGAEWYKWQTLTPEHNVALAFTRNVVGPMDYTPVTFSADSRHTTAGHELALSVVFESALQHFADGIEEYASRPEAEAFLERVPAAWEETCLVQGYPGTEATIARRAREDGEWFLGSITAGPRRTVSFDVTFLDGERTAHLVRDDENDELIREMRTVSPDDTLDVAVPRNGGFAVRFE